MLPLFLHIFCNFLYTSYHRYILEIVERKPPRVELLAFPHTQITKYES